MSSHIDMDSKGHMMQSKEKLLEPIKSIDIYHDLNVTVGGNGHGKSSSNSN